jgi:Spy/CpxP family protein refolding chaperone
MSWRSMAGVASVLAVTLCAMPAAGQGFRGMPPDGGGPGGPLAPIMLLIRGVGLTDAQQAQVRQIVAGHRPRFEALRTQLRVASEQLAEKLYAAGPVSIDDVAPLRQQVSQLRDQMGQEALQTALEVRGVLTPDQLAKAAQIRQRLRELRGEMRSLVGGEH